MAKQPGPYDQYDDFQLLVRYAKLCEDKEVHYPWWAGNAGVELDPKKSMDAAVKIDKVVIECYRRGLMGPNGQESKLPPDERDKVAKKALEALKAEWEMYSKILDGLPELPFSEALTPKAKALRPWTDPSLQGKYHEFIHHQKQEELAQAAAPVVEKFEALRKKACEEENKRYEEWKQRGINKTC